MFIRFWSSIDESSPIGGMLVYVELSNRLKSETTVWAFENG